MTRLVTVVAPSCHQTLRDVVDIHCLVVVADVDEEQRKSQMRSVMAVSEYSSTDHTAAQLPARGPTRMDVMKE